MAVKEFNNGKVAFTYPDTWFLIEDELLIDYRENEDLVVMLRNDELKSIIMLLVEKRNFDTIYQIKSEVENTIKKRGELLYSYVQQIGNRAVLDLSEKIVSGKYVFGENGEFSDLSKIINSEGDYTEIHSLNFIDKGDAYSLELISSPEKMKDGETDLNLIYRTFYVVDHYYTYKTKDKKKRNTKTSYFLAIGLIIFLILLLVKFAHLIKY